jgi:hypothetical protein
MYVGGRAVEFRDVKYFFGKELPNLFQRVSVPEMDVFRPEHWNTRKKRCFPE